MINYKSILAGEVRRRKYFRRLAKVYRNRWRRCEKDVLRLVKEKDAIERRYDSLSRNMDYIIELRLQDGIAAERFAIEYDYCQKIDALEAKLAVYEASRPQNEDGTVGMVLSSEQCNRLNAELKRLQHVEKKYKFTCDKLQCIKKVLNETIILDKTFISV